jgi:hypothetical protein
MVKTKADWWLGLVISLRIDTIYQFNHSLYCVTHNLIYEFYISIYYALDNTDAVSIYIYDYDWPLRLYRNICHRVSKKEEIYKQ